MNQLFQAITFVMTVIGVVVIIWLVAELFSDLAYINRPGIGYDTNLQFNRIMTYIALVRNTKLILIANASEVALVWLLVLLDAISKRCGLITTLVLFILSTITVFIVYSSNPLLH